MYSVTGHEGSDEVTIANRYLVEVEEVSVDSNVVKVGVVKGYKL